MHENAEQFLLSELARAEAVIASDTKTIRQHQPTIDNHRGQAMAIRKAIEWLKMDKPKVVIVEVEKESDAWVIYAGIACLIVLVTVGVSFIAACWPR
jgi:hypothetical protein